MSEGQNQEKETPQLEFPIEGAKSCPRCGSTERIGLQYIEQLKRNKRLNKNAYPLGGLQFSIPFQETLSGPIALGINPSIPALQVMWDICARCFSIYCIRVDETQIPVQIRNAAPSRIPF
jgi:hypothetical protein